MRKRIVGPLLLFFTLSLFWGCSSGKWIKKTEPEAQASVRFTLTDGSQREGMIFSGNQRQIVYIDAKSHHRDSLKLAQIRSIRRLDKYFDFEGNVIPDHEIRSLRKHTKTILYGAGGMLLGATAGTGLSIALFRPKKEGDKGNSNAAIATIIGFGAAGAWLFGTRGAAEDWDRAAFTARKQRIKELKQVIEEKKKIEQLKKEKARLLKEIKEKKTKGKK